MLFQGYSQIGYDRTHIGFENKARPVAWPKSRRCPLHQDAATRPGSPLWRADQSFYASELIRIAGTGSGAAQRELAKLEDSGLVVGRRIGHQKHYQANASSPLFAELRSIMLKTVGSI
jgi:hypothetical protein